MTGRGGCQDPRTPIALFCWRETPRQAARHPPRPARRDRRSRKTRSIIAFEAVTINCGALSDDPAIQAIIAEELQAVGQGLVNELVAAGCLRDVTEIAVKGRLAFVRAVCVKWIQSQSISRVDLTDMCRRAFAGALGTPTSRLRGRILRGKQPPVITLLP
jgi:hypothetical protein